MDKYNEETGQISLEKYLKDLYLEVLWSSDWYSRYDDYPCIIQFVGKFRDPRARQEDFVKGFLIGIDKNSGEVRFVSDPPTGQWDEFVEYLDCVFEHPDSLYELVDRHCMRPRQNRDDLPEGSVLDDFYGERGRYS